jgi:hypothetical protein
MAVFVCSSYMNDVHVQAQQSRSMCTAQSLKLLLLLPV